MQFDDLIGVRDAFLEEMRQSIRGTKSSLPFIRHQLPDKALVPDGEEFQVLVIGGTVFSNALMKRENGTLTIVDRRNGVLPVMDTKDTFLAFVNDAHYDTARFMAVNFAYALSPRMRNGRLDGELVWGSKEHTFTGLIGELVGEEIEAYLQQYRKLVTVTVANDTICMLLAGSSTYSWDSFACGIVGTGLNFAMYLDARTVVNLEAGEFDKLTLSAEGTVLDAASASPGSALLEKEVAGAYLYQKYNIHIKEQGIDVPELASTEQLDDIARNERHPANAIAREILDRSAALVAATASAIMEYHQGDLTFSMAGSLFWKGEGYKEAVERHMKRLSPTLRSVFVSVPDSELFGAAGLLT